MTVHWVSERSDSVVSEIETPDGRVIVKQHRPEADIVRTASVRAEHEYRVLRMLHAAMDAEYSVPRALELDASQGTVILERATGTPLDVLIRELKKQDDGAELLAPHLRRAGRWLRAMQDATRATGDGRAVLAAQVESALGRTDSDRIRARLRELATNVASRPLTVCGHHGDFWPGNLFLDEQRVQAIDFEGYREGLPLEDVAYFLLQLELLLPRHRRHLPKLRAAFLEGYGGIGDEDALKLFTLTKTLHLIARNAGARHPFLLRWWTRRTLRNIIDGCLQ